MGRHPSLQAAVQKWFAALGFDDKTQGVQRAQRPKVPSIVVFAPASSVCLCLRTSLMYDVYGCIESTEMVE